MSAIVTPGLVRRYLNASGWTVGERGFLTKLARKVGLFPTMTPYDLDYEIDKIAHLERKSRSDVAARLGMLAAAEMLFARASKLESSTNIDGSYEAAVKRREDKREAFSLRNEAERLVEAAGVDPKAWEAAR